MQIFVFPKTLIQTTFPTEQVRFNFADTSRHRQPAPDFDQWTDFGHYYENSSD